jgi:5-methylcytosine-specific restriction enzyme subunit McrC
MAEDRDLRRRAHRLSARFGDVERLARLDVGNIDRAERALTRLTAANRPALTIIRLPLDTLGLAFDSAPQSNRMPGFLFDMNIFFQRLLSRFLHDNLTSTRIADEVPIRNLFAYTPNGNPLRRTAPAPRPDYAIFRGDMLYAFLDAKYRDIWERGLPAEWLYQLSLYALGSPCQVSVLLYASMAADARDELLEVRQPVMWSDKGPALVIVRPVPLPYLAEILAPDRFAGLASKRRELADQFVVPRIAGLGSSL